MIRVAVIDDGINDTLINCRVQHFNVVSDNDDDVELFSHGTICAKFIEEYGMVDCIYDVRCLNKNGEGDINLLINAMVLCSELDITHINISNGIENFICGSYEYNSLLSICYLLHKKGVKIFAAQSNYGAITIPADFTFVKSVEELEPINNIVSRIYRQSDCYVREIPSAIIRKYKKFVHCNSYACAYLCGISTISDNLILRRSWVEGESLFFICSKMIQWLRAQFFVVNNHRISSLFYGDCMMEMTKQNKDCYSRDVIFDKKIGIFKMIYIRMKCNLKGGLYWYPTRYSKFWAVNKKIEQPIVYIYGDMSEMKKIEIGKELQVLFTGDGYIADIISDSPNAIKYSLHYVDYIEKELQNYCSVSGADIIIYVVQCNIVKNICDDIVVYIENNSVSIVGDKYHIFFSEIKVKDIYKEVINHYK